MTEERTSDRSIKIDGDVSGSIIVSGDANTLAKIKTRKFIAASPYKGLEKFEQVDKDRFFGREQFVHHLLNDLLPQTNLLLLLGASGSGKSSVVRAGLVPQLAQQWGERLINLTFNPDYDPFESLYICLSRYYRQTETQFVRQGKAETLVEIVKTLKPSDAYWFIFIDQFEELFTTSQVEKCNRFIAGLVQLDRWLKQFPLKDCRVKVVVAMRSDLLNRLSPYPALVKATDRFRPIIAELQPDELRLAIEQPAAQHGVVFEDGLVEEIIKSVERQSGYLPLAQYTLDLLWKTEMAANSIHDRTLNISTYRELGGVRGALQKHVDQIYGALSEKEQLAAQRIFLNLVDIGKNAESETDWKPLRRRVFRSTFNDGLEQQVLQKLIDTNLLVSDHSLQAGESTVEVAHEVLLTAWTTLENWIREKWQAIVLRNRLDDDVARWQAKESEDELWSGSKLEQVLELRKDSTFNEVLGGFNREANRFIDASIARRNLQRHRTTIGLISFSVFALILASFAGWQADSARRSERKAVGRELALKADVILRNFEALNSPTSTTGQIEELIEALKIGREYGRFLPDNLPLNQYTVAKPIFALQQILYKISEKNRFQHKDRVRSVSFSQDGKTILTGSSDGRAILWHHNGQKIREFSSDGGEVLSVALSPNNRYVLVGFSHSKAILWNQDGRELKQFLHKGAVNDVSFSSDSQKLLTGSSDNKAILWNLEGKILATFSHTQSINSVSFNFDESKILTGSDDHSATLWNANGSLIKKFQYESAVDSVAWSPNGREFVVGLRSGIGILRDMEGNLLESYLHKDAINSVSFSPEGGKILTGSNDGKAILWNRNAKVLQQFQNGQTGEFSYVYSAKFSPNGNEILTGFGNGVAVLWNINKDRSKRLDEGNSVCSLSASSDGEEILAGLCKDKAILWTREGRVLQEFKHEGAINSVSFHPNGQKILTASDSGTVILWTRQGEKLRSFGDEQDSVLEPIYSASFSPDGTTVLTGSRGIVRVWSVNGQLIRKVEIRNSNNSNNKELNPSPIRSVSFSTDGKEILAGAEDGKVWKGTAANLVELLRLDSIVYRAVFSSTGNYILTGSEDSKARLWSSSGKLIQEFNHKGAVYSVSASRDGELVLTGSADGLATLWNRKGEKLQQFLHPQGVNSAILSSDKRFIVTSSRDNITQLWQVYTVKDLTGQSCNWLKDSFVYSRANEEILSLCPKSLN